MELFLILGGILVVAYFISGEKRSRRKRISTSLCKNAKRVYAIMLLKSLVRRENVEMRSTISVTIALLALTVSACVPESGTMSTTPTVSTPNAMADRPGTRISANDILPFSGQWGTDSCQEYNPSNYVCDKATRVIEADGTVKNYIWNLNGSSSLASEGYLARDSQGRIAVFLTQQTIDGKTSIVNPPQPITELRMRLENGVTILEGFWIDSPVTTAFSRELKVNDLKRGYSIGFENNDGDAQYPVLKPNLTRLAPIQRKQAQNSSSQASKPSPTSSATVSGANSCLRKIPGNTPPWQSYTNSCNRRIKCNLPDHDFSNPGAIFQTNRVLGREFNCRYYDG